MRTLLLLTLTLPAAAQTIPHPHASLVDVPARIATLKSTQDPLLRAAIKSLKSCTKLPEVTPPTGRILIPHHYLTGSSGPANPAEKEATRIYGELETRVAAGMNQYLATGSHAEAACALTQLDTWAAADTLLDYDRKESSQAYYQVEWTLASIGTSFSVLVNDPALDLPTQKRVAAWLDKAAHKNISFEKPTESFNNHHYWRALAAISIAVPTGDESLFHYALEAYRGAIAEIAADGALPREMARHENAIGYQGFAIAPLVAIAQFAARQNVDLYAYTANAHTLRDAIIFYGRATADPSLVKPYTTDEQKGHYTLGNYATFAFYAARFGTTGLPPTITEALTHPLFDTRLGGSTTLLAAK